MQYAQGFSFSTAILGLSTGQEFLELLLIVVLHHWVLYFLGTTFHPSFVEDIFHNPHLMHLFLGSALLSSYRIPWLHPVWWLLLLCHSRSVPYASFPTMKMSSAIQNTLVLPLKFSRNFHWKNPPPVPLQWWSCKSVPAKLTCKFI